MRAALLATLILIHGICHAGQRTPTPPAPKGTIEGVVVKATTGEPLKKAWVTLRRAQGRERSESAMTDASGRFTLKDIEPGPYILQADRNGFVSRIYGQRGPESPGTTLTVGPGQTIRDIEIRMTPAAAISGHVLDEDGEPVAWASVSVLRYNYYEGKRKLEPEGDATTNDLGEYRVFGLGAGRYFLSAVSDQLSRPAIVGSWSSKAEGKGAAEMAYAPTYYPGTPDLMRAAPLELRAGDDLSGLDLTLLSARAVRIRGRILNVLAGKGTRRTTLTLVPRETNIRSYTSFSGSMVEDPQGQFELRGVVPGAYVLMAAMWDGERLSQAQVPLDVGLSDIEGLNITLDPGTEVAGQVQWEGATRGRESGLRVLLRAREKDMFTGGRVGEVKADNKFKLKNVTDGDYRIRLDDAPEECFLKSARLGGEEVLQDGFTVSGGKIAGPLELVLSCSGGTIEGVVLNQQQQPVTGARVVLIPDAERRGRTDLFKSTTPDQYGHFILKGIAPGDYKLFAWEEVEYGAYQDPDFLERYEDDGKAVTVAENGRYTAQLRLIPAE